ncbi:MAG: hypothetical protein QG608_1861 [Actinomycetota bacterium]|nr:hypothetical protein [Actinomycetota bacterium]
MSNRSASSEATTYLVESEAEAAQIIDFCQALAARGGQVPDAGPALVTPTGERLELPPQVFEAFQQVLTALSRGLGVTIASRNAMLTTQEAAEFLGISRPTLVKLLESGQISFQRRGRHRRVMLTDLITYQDASRHTRREALDTMIEDALDADLYQATLGQPPRTR